MARGGKRPGAGRPKGTTGPQQKTIEKALLRQQAVDLIAPHIPELIASQVANAKGLKYLVTRDKKTGKFLRVGSAQAANPNEETIEVWEKDPSVQAFAEILNRALDKAKEQEQEIKVTGDEDLIARLLAGRRRAAEARK